MMNRLLGNGTVHVARRFFVEAICLFCFFVVVATTSSNSAVVFAEDSGSQTIDVQPWQIPSPTLPYPNLDARPGDVIRFVWENNHTVHIHPTGTCDTTGRILVGESSPSQYIFTEADAGNVLTFACDVGSHCEFGMIFNVTVTAAAEAATLAPSVAATTTVAPVTPAPTTSAPSTVAPTVAPVVPTAAPVVPTTPAPTTAAPITPAPTLVPTLAPTTAAPVAVPTTPAPTTDAPVTPAPTDAAEPTMMPSISQAPSTGEPASEPTPVSGGRPVSTTLTGLRIGMAGVDSFPPTTQETWSAFTGEFSEGSIAEGFADTVSNFRTTYEVTSFEIVPLRRRGLSISGRWLRNSNSDDDRRQLQGDSSVIVVYDQTVTYITTDPDTYTPELLVTDPFATTDQKSQYVTFLGTSSDPNLEAVSGVSNVEVPPQTPTAAPVEVAPTSAPTEADTSPLSTPAIIGIACGGGALLILAVLYFLYCRNRGGSSGATGSKYQSDLGDEPPLQVSIREDEVSTLAGPAGGPPTYGDQSVATVDYDYSKAYGGEGDTSVSSAGGTFGSNTQNNQPSALDPRSAAATGAALGSMNDDGESFDAQYHDPAGNTREQVMHIFAPPGKLGVVIDTPDDGAPVVHAVKDSSVIASKIQVGDKLVAVDDEDVRAMTAIKVSKLISRKSANPSRKLTIVRTTVG